MEKILFNSKSEFYKSPFGALRESESCRIKIKLSESLGVKSASLLLRKDGEQRAELRFELKLSGCEAGYAVYSADFSVENKGLYFYKFELTFENGAALAGKGEGDSAFIGENSGEWILFVYDKNFRTPEFAKGGIIYQIFPDRFYRSDNFLPGASKDERIIHDNWYEKPYSVYDREGYKCNDYFMGNLKGVTEKLDYIKSLGATVIYLNPIFESSENHRYCTGDYKKIDPYLGTEEDFTELCSEAEKRNIRIIIDGVFSHTGADSRYFNRYGHYDEPGAYNSPDSKYFDWYTFTRYPDEYDSWWGFKSLPNVNELNDKYSEFICGKDGVLSFWLSRGAGGWRLDVADELPDEFMKRLRSAVKSENEDALIIGEVWENGVLKESYGARRKFLEGGMCDSLMNYPFKNAVIELVKNKNTRNFYNTVMDIVELYPKPAIDALMNFLSTHDTVRIINEFGVLNPIRREDSGKYVMSHEEYERGKTLSLIAAALIFTLPGNPSVFYGDEAGVTGFYDPFCRMTYPWGCEDNDILSCYRQLGKIRTENREDFLKPIEFELITDKLICYSRGKIKVCVNLSGSAKVKYAQALYCRGGEADSGEAVLNGVSVLIYTV